MFGTYLWYLQFCLPVPGVTVSGIYKFDCNLLRNNTFNILYILKCFTQNFQNGGIFTIHMRKADLKTDL